jgi:uncharacterized membrane protein
MLMPAAALVILILGAITFDYAHLYLAKRELQTAAEAAAQDAVTFGVDQAAVRRGNGVQIDEQLLLRAVDVSLSAHGGGLHLEGAPLVELVGPTQVRVTLRGRVGYLFVPVVPGVAHSAVVRASALASVG